MGDRLPTVIRCSSLSDYPDCNRRGAARLFRNIINAMGFRLRSLPRSSAAAIGTSVHRAVSVALDEKARTGALPPVSVPLDAGRDALHEQTTQYAMMFDGPHGPTHNLGDAAKQVQSMVRVYHATVAPTVEPVIIEQRLEAEVEPGLILSGQPDLVAREPKMVRDLKTGVRSPSNPAPQIGGYSLLSRTHGHDIERAVIDFVRRVPVTKMQPDPLSVAHQIEHAETAAANIMRSIARDLHVFQHGDDARHIRPGDPWAFQANPSSVLCSAKWCPAFGTDFCHEGREAK